MPAPSRGHALVTGASAGIGAAFARALASRGTPLVLVARRADRLESLAAELRTAHGIEVVVLPCDLADPHAPATLQAELEASGIFVGTLVNNAGYGVTGYLLSQPWETHAAFLQVLLTAPTELCHRFLPAMRERGFGRIVNVASLAGHVPGSAGQTLYAGTKAYLVKLSQALTLEYGDEGVHTCALCPGFTWSEFHDVTGSRELMSKMPRWMWMDADTVVAQGLDAVERGEAVLVNGRVNRLIKTMFKLLPDRMALRMIGRRSRQFRKAAPD
ncbi:SDR family NAD(P)-dependent oxidoreductase [Dokdonella sp. MW10]|uniref:SDR family NAD(P)-dependent oxidoreductase n=1 Tax=Dokdonella sp. MW10 TaxID=2992926 RepID=UPI003F7D373C